MFSRSPLASYVLALAMPGLASLFTLLLWRWLQASPLVLFFPAVMTVALYAGIGPALLATVLSTLSLAFLFMSSYASPAISRADLIRLVAFATTTILTAWLASGRRRAEDAHQRLAAALEQRIAERTVDLEATNRALEREIVERGRLEEQIRHTHSSEALGRLAGGIAHDFNNLLTVIIGSTDLLAEEIPADTESRTLVLEIQKAATRAASLTRQLLAYSRRQ